MISSDHLQTTGIERGCERTVYCSAAQVDVLERWYVDGGVVVLPGPPRSLTRTTTTCSSIRSLRLLLLREPLFSLPSLRVKEEKPAEHRIGNKRVRGKTEREERFLADDYEAIRWKAENKNWNRGCGHLPWPFMRQGHWIISSSVPGRTRRRR